MGDTSTAVAKSNVIPFRSTKLLLVERDGQPFVPMKPVVEGMGLAWQTQHRKLMAGRFASVITMMVTTGFDGKQYEMACLPLKKLPGWLMSIHASKVRPDLRENVLVYQDECDDALWAYWNEGHAVNHRGPGQAMTVLGQTIGTDGFHMLGAVVKGKVSSLPAQIQRRATAKIWSQTHAAFGVRSAADIPADQLDAARNFIAAYAVLEGEFMPKEQGKSVEIPSDLSETQRYLVFIDGFGKRQVQPVPLDACVMSPTQFLAAVTGSNGIHVSPAALFDFALAAMGKVKWRVAA
ncbi:P22 AR-like protein [Pseudomonas asplenii]|uniref:p22 AR-like protein n=2 Tax=Pseudomonas asplenii TaxID=53407 RepID=A0A0N0E101_9PSED|nr:P22 AR-like protein [Pseudomonas fuscovaginae]